jgi:hypothetical protein
LSKFLPDSAQTEFERTKSLPPPLLAVKRRAKNSAEIVPKPGTSTVLPSSTMNRTYRQFAIFRAALFGKY